MAKQRERYLSKYIETDLGKKMVLLGGPRQVGKTTLARNLGAVDADYMNYDVPVDRTRILKQQFKPDKDLLIFDEIHKFKSWRNYLKGLYDSSDRHHKSILVTGSAKLDFYRKGGDSLQGRYFHFRLHPFTVAELKIKSQADFHDLLRLGGFPEPYFSASDKDALRWRADYRDRLVREDVSTLERVLDLSQLELLALRLPDLVGSPLSINNVREDLSVSHRAVSNWLNIFERVYLIYRLPPFGSAKIKAVKKEQKHYMWDWATVEDDGARFENLVAGHLLKWTHFQRDTEGRQIELQYLRDQTGREVDFVLVEKGKPLMMVEAKRADHSIHSHLSYFKNKFPQARAVQVVANPKNEFVSKEGIELISAVRFLKELV